ncbi:anthranilate phosphoribosyltransferase [Alkalispirochaeta americana]|uniref:Anthranilate phosphoribosyltransferase n=1 Tax=Alkalispirochaeta americana TaxID=159291 RepID=A0A1N6T370_9SPIO|nr:anthranilate phosphoribosyltransferase [Alkalispirochaeta americana]SIQ47845.1 anthranilate phosphoribosyltransferase [Alkalispirochaeta americana]
MEKIEGPMESAMTDVIKMSEGLEGLEGAPMGDRAFGALVSRLIGREDLDFGTAREAFREVLSSRVTEMHQGAFLGALAAKGEALQELAAAWQVIYELDTVKPLEKEPPDVQQHFLSLKVVENCGTGMDSFKTFNISTAASVVAAACGVSLARHGARSITSRCGTVDIAEALGVDPDVPVSMVLRSVTTAGIGLFNGMSPAIHPQALGRILSQISFGSCLNIAASLCNPVMPKIGVRGVYARELVEPVAELMRQIGYHRGMVLYGEIDNSFHGMDEASVCGTTWCAEFSDQGPLKVYSFRPGDAGLAVHDPREIAPSGDLSQEAGRFVRTILGVDVSARIEAVLLNASCLLYVAGKARDLSKGVILAREAIESGAAFDRLDSWVRAQNSDPQRGAARLRRLRTLAGLASGERP